MKFTDAQLHFLEAKIERAKGPRMQINLNDLRGMLARIRTAEYSERMSFGGFSLQDRQWAHDKWRRVIEE